VNFFKLYIGDYQRDTGTLSLSEHGAYMLMLQHYYATEAPLPIGKALHRMLRAQDKAEREAIDSVAKRFWTETDAGLVNERADAEITKASAQAETNARIAREREARRKSTRNVDEQSTNRATNDQPNQTPDTIASKTPPEGGVGARTRPSRKCPVDFAVTPEMQAWAVTNAPLVNARLATDAFRDHTFKSAISDWPGAWRNWLRRDQQHASERGSPAIKPAGKHAGFQTMNYREGVSEDGTFA
jgi:uncharacterized protein YdaU (DUF1376 family)